TSSAAKGQAGDGIIPGKQNSHCGLNAFSRAFVKLQKRSGRSPDFASLISRSHSQWRDRAGFSPASLFSPLLCGAPERCVKELGTFRSVEVAAKEHGNISDVKIRG